MTVRKERGRWLGKKGEAGRKVTGATDVTKDWKIVKKSPVDFRVNLPVEKKERRSFER